MPKIYREERDLKTIRETELIISRRFRRVLNDLNYDDLAADLRGLYNAGQSRGKYSVFYFVFTFTIKNTDTAELSPEIQRYILESLKQRFKGRFDDIESAPDADIKNWRVITSASIARKGELETFINSLPSVFDKQVKQKFNVEVDHEIILTAASCILKKARRTKAAKKGIRSKRKRSRVKVVVYKLKGRKRIKSKSRKRITLRKGRSRGKSSRKIKTQTKKRTKKLRRI